MAEAGPDGEIGRSVGGFGASPLPAYPNNLDRVEALQARESLLAEGLGEPLGDEEVIPGDFDEIAEFLTMQYQLDTIGREPEFHPNGLTTPRAARPLREVLGFNCINISIVMGPDDAFLQDEEARRRGLRSHGETF
jgi:hypothetical protein